jgi:hypothetical protein
MRQNLSCRCGGPRSSARTFPGQPVLPTESAYRPWSSRKGSPERRRRPALATNDSLQSQITRKLWCTGKDSNLRTSLGGTDLQSVGFNHSPTCAKCLTAESGSAALRRCTSFKSGTKTDRNQGARKHPHTNTTSGNFPYGVLLEKLLSRRASPASGTDPPSSMLELAKGFEPPTL